MGAMVTEPGDNLMKRLFRSTALPEMPDQHTVYVNSMLYPDGKIGDNRLPI